MTEKEIKQLANQNNFIELNDSIINFFKIKLEEELKFRIEETKNVAKGMSENGEDLSDEGDIANKFVENGLLSTVANYNNVRINKIKLALDRIKDGEYGYCLQNGEPIGIKRLLIDPTNEYCIESAELVEKQNRIFKNRSF